MLKRLFWVWFILIAGVLPAAGAQGWIFVTPEPRDSGRQPSGMNDVRIVDVPSGRAFAFREVAPGDDTRVDAVRALLAGSKAWRKAVDLLGQARRLAPAPGQKWIAGNAPLPIWILPPNENGRGPGVTSLMPLRVTTARAAFDAAQLLQVDGLKLPGGAVLTVGELASAGALLPMLCHELFHAIQAELYRERYIYFTLLGEPAGPHDSPAETDPMLAFREGFAEAGELWLGEQYPEEFAVRRGRGIRPESVRFAEATFKNRQVLAARNRFIYTADGRVKDGRLDSGKTDLSTEGVIASLLQTILGHAGLPDAPHSVFTTMARGAPLTFFDFVSALMRDNPARAATIRCILLEFTCYTIASPDAISRYQAYYLARKAFLVGKLPREEYLRVRNAWQEWKDLQRQRIEAGAPLVEAVPQPLIVASKQGYTLDLNDPDLERLAWHLESFLPASDTVAARQLAAHYAAQIAEQRSRFGMFFSVRQLDGAVPASLLAQFETGWKAYLEKAEVQLDREISRRRRLEGY
ncbi:MAG TPA: hypothetical protein PLU72_17210 [Candidatus Ozemobacteraceae bacterium]|nr:hypothetical protein [Candidatus Ozemobacteraceae bacterium]